MEHKIGEIFEYNGEWYQCLESPTCNCKHCDFYDNKHDLCHISPQKCLYRERSDKKDVIFKKLEKVGEPFTSVGKLYQHYKVFDIDNVYGDAFLCVHNYKAKTLTIEIKQNKEDMEEKKEITLDEMIKKCEELEFNSYYKQVKDWLIELKQCKEEKHSNSENIGKNLKPFDLKAAKAGKPVCTRDGRKARIICFDRKDNTPIIALIECVNHAEILQCVHNDGKCFHYDTSNNDLMMLPEKKEGWINIYRSEKGEYWYGQLLFSTKKDAIDAHDHAQYVTTVKVEWEE